MKTWFFIVVFFFISGCTTTFYKLKSTCALWWNVWKLFLFFSFYSALINIPTVFLFSLLPQHVKGHLNFVLQIGMWSENTVSQICRLSTYNLNDLRLSLGSPGHVLLPFLPLPCLTSFLRWFTHFLQSGELQSQIPVTTTVCHILIIMAEFKTSWDIIFLTGQWFWEISLWQSGWVSHRLQVSQALSRTKTMTGCSNIFSINPAFPLSTIHLRIIGSLWTLHHRVSGSSVPIIHLLLKIFRSIVWAPINISPNNDFS